MVSGNKNKDFMNFLVGNMLLGTSDMGCHCQSVSGFKQVVFNQVMDK